MARQMSATARPSSSASVTTTLTVENSSQPPRESLVLHLRPRKKVTWKEGTVDNEFMNKKSSKVCCIFHKDKPFDEDDSDDDGHGPNHCPDHDDGCGPSTSGAH